MRYTRAHATRHQRQHESQNQSVRKTPDTQTARQIDPPYRTRSTPCTLVTPPLSEPRQRLPDAEVYRQELRLAEMAEPLGFDSIWSVEHHFTDYTMCPDVLQFLTYMAGKTQHVKLGTMVIVLPWHDPIRVAEQIALLDHLSGGRLILGLGRGLARVEYEGFRIDQDEGRQRFVEYAQLILDGLEQGYIEGGATLQQPRRDIRPSPLKSFRGAPTPRRCRRSRCRSWRSWALVCL